MYSSWSDPFLSPQTFRAAGDRLHIGGDHRRGFVSHYPVMVLLCSEGGLPSFWPFR